jgi:hypothetical protein
MREALFEIKISKDKNSLDFSLEYIRYKYISNFTVTKMEPMIHKIYKLLPKELIRYHHLMNKAVFIVKEESTGIYIESPYIDLIKKTSEYNYWLHSIISSIKRDYAIAQIKEKINTLDAEIILSDKN